MLYALICDGMNKSKVRKLSLKYDSEIKGENVRLISTN